MDIQRPSNARAKKIRRIVYGTVALLLVGGVTYGLSKLRPAAPIDGQREGDGEADQVHQLDDEEGWRLRSVLLQ